jgi:hypothetical protein
MSTRGKTIGRLAGVALLVAVVIGQTSTVSSRAPATYAETTNLVGEQLANALGLSVIPVADGEALKEGDTRLAGCETSGAPDEAGYLVDAAGGFYCTTSVTKDPYQAWDLATRLTGHVPTDAEQKAFTLSQLGDQAYAAGDRDKALDYYSQAQDALTPSTAQAGSDVGAGASVARGK